MRTDLDQLGIKLSCCGGLFGWSQQSYSNLPLTYCALEAWPTKFSLQQS